MVGTGQMQVNRSSVPLVMDGEVQLCSLAPLRNQRLSRGLTQPEAEQQSTDYLSTPSQEGSLHMWFFSLNPFL